MTSRLTASLLVPVVSALLGCTATPYSPASSYSYRVGSFLVGYDCASIQQEPYGKVTVAADVDERGNFQNGRAFLTTVTTDDFIEISYKLSDKNLMVPVSPLYVKVRLPVEVPPTQVITLFLTLNSGERHSEFVIDAAAARANRGTRSTSISADGVASDTMFVEAFGKASSFAIDIVDAKGKTLVHKVRPIDLAPALDVIKRLAVQVKDKLDKPKTECSEIYLNVD